MRPEKEGYLKNSVLKKTAACLGVWYPVEVKGNGTVLISGKAIKVCKINRPNELHLPYSPPWPLSLNDGSEMKKVTFFWWFSPGNSFSLASFIGSSAPSSLPHHILRLHVIMKTLPSPFIWHLPSFQGCGLQEDIWQVWRWLWGKYRRSGAGHTHQGSWVGNLLLIILLSKHAEFYFSLVCLILIPFQISLMQTEPVWHWGGSDPERNWCRWKRGNWPWRIPFNNEVRPAQVGIIRDVLTNMFQKPIWSHQMFIFYAGLERCS